MTSETIIVNGIDLRGLVNNIESLTGLLATPGRRGENIILAGRHGRARVPRKRYDEGTIVLPMGVRGTPITAYDDVPAYYARVDTLTRLFAAETLTVDHVFGDGTIRRCEAELDAAPLNFTREVTSPLYGTFTVTMTIPGAFWADVTPTSQAFSLTTGNTFSLTNFAAITAPTDELSITFGPGSNPLLTQVSTGTFFAYDGIISAGRELVVNTSDWSLDDGAGTAWFPDYRVMRFGGDPRWFSLYPEGPAPIVRLTHTGGGSMSVTVAGKRKYLVG